MSDTPRQILLIGNANTGKTTLFNALTGKFRKTGNYFGVTVDESTATVNMGGQKTILKDLPGLTNIDGAAGEQLITVRALTAGGYNAIIYVCSAVSLARNMYLLDEIKSLQISNIVVAVNMSDEAEAQGISIDYAKLSRRLGVPVIGVSARTKHNLSQLIDCIENQKGFVSRSNIGKVRIASLSEVANRYNRIDGIVNDCVKLLKPPKQGLSRLDRFVMGRVTGKVIFVLLTAAIFWLVFGAVAPFLSEGLGGAVDRLRLSIGNHMDSMGSPMWMSAMVTDGVIGGIGSVAEFLPQIVILYIAVAVLEDVGYMSRAAYITDGAMCGLGLKGRSTYTLAMGFGCTAAAASTARAIEAKGAKLRTLVLLPLMSCSAKLPVYIIIASAFFGRMASMMAVAAYCVGVAIFVVAARLIRPKCNDDGIEVLEIPPYRFPSLLRVFRLAGHNIVSFLLRIGTFVLVVNLIVWVLGHFSLVWGYVPDGQLSIMHTTTKVITPIFRPLGLGDWRIVSALISGLAAKEAIISALEALGGVSAIITTARQAVVVMTFVLLYTPCFAAVAALAKEAGRRVALMSSIVYFVGAYVAALMVNVAWGLFTHSVLGGIILVSAVLVLVILLRLLTDKNRSHCGGVCEGNCWK